MPGTHVEVILFYHETSPLGAHLLIYCEWLEAHLRVI